MDSKCSKCQKYNCCCLVGPRGPRGCPGRRGKDGKQ